jgi:hypothetical protein
LTRILRIGSNSIHVSEGNLENPKGIPSFSPALADEIGLRRVAKRNDNNPEGVESVRADLMQPFQGWNFWTADPG